MSTTIIDAALALPDHRVHGRRGRIAVASWDQDVITLGAQAARTVLDRNRDRSPSALILASVTAPYTEGANVGILAEMLGAVGPGIAGIELGGTTSAGFAAIKAASTMWSPDDCVLVVTGDAGRTDGRQRFGDGAVAMLVGGDGEAGTLEDAGASLDWFMDRWRLDGAASLTQGDRSLRAVSPGKSFAGRVGADTHVDDANPSLDGAGYIGCGTAPLALLKMFAGKRKGTRRIVSVSSGGVSLALRLTAGTKTKRVAAAIVEVLGGGVDGAPPPAPDLSGFDPYTSESRRWRERASDLRLEASVNADDGSIRYPPRPGGERTRLPVSGTVFTHTTDHVYPVGGPQAMAVVDLDGGGRFYGQVIDGCSVDIGDPVELVPRRLHLGGGVPQYFWKVAPEGRH